MSYALRVLRHLFTERSYERYYSPGVWDDKWGGDYGLDARKEDGRYGALLALMERHAGNGPVLDAGCGDGILEAKFRAVSPVRTVGIDYSREAIDRAKARPLAGCTFVQADYRDFRSDERFPLIVLNESLYYVDDAVGVMRALSRWLAHDGIFIVSMFDTRVTRRIWNALAGAYVPVQGVSVRDEGTGQAWRLRVLRAA